MNRVSTLPATITTLNWVTGRGVVNIMHQINRNEARRQQGFIGAILTLIGGLFA